MTTSPPSRHRKRLKRNQRHYLCHNQEPSFQLPETTTTTTTAATCCGDDSLEMAEVDNSQPQQQPQQQRQGCFSHDKNDLRQQSMPETTLGTRQAKELSEKVPVLEKRLESLEQQLRLPDHNHQCCQQHKQQQQQQQQQDDMPNPAVKWEDGEEPRQPEKTRHSLARLEERMTHLEHAVQLILRHHRHQRQRQRDEPSFPTVVQFHKHLKVKDPWHEDHFRAATDPREATTRMADSNSRPAAKATPRHKLPVVTVKTRKSLRVPPRRTPNINNNNNKDPPAVLRTQPKRKAAGRKEYAGSKSPTKRVRINKHETQTVNVVDATAAKTVSQSKAEKENARNNETNDDPGVNENNSSSTTTTTTGWDVIRMCRPDETCRKCRTRPAKSEWAETNGSLGWIGDDRWPMCDDCADEDFEVWHFLKCLRKSSRQVCRNQGCHKRARVVYFQSQDKEDHWPLCGSCEQKDFSHEAQLRGGVLPEEEEETTTEAATVDCNGSTSLTNDGKKAVVEFSTNLLPTQEAASGGNAGTESELEKTYNSSDTGSFDVFDC